MSVLTNPKHEAFAQALAKGRTQIEAYAAAGYKPNDGHAARLAGNGRIKGRVAEIQAKVAARAVVTVHSLVEELEEARALALEEKQTAAAVSASLGKAKLLGLVVERRHHSGAVGSYDLSNVSDDDLERLEAILGPVADAGGDPGGEAPA